MTAIINAIGEIMYILLSNLSPWGVLAIGVILFLIWVKMTRDFWQDVSREPTPDRFPKTFWMED